MKRLVLFVEGQGDEAAVSTLVKRTLTELNAWDAVLHDPKPMRVGHVNQLLSGGSKRWIKFLNMALKRREVGGILVVLDGDIKKVEGETFCAKRVAAKLAREAARAGAGVKFSVAIVFAMQEFETWLIAGIESLAGRDLPDGRAGVRTGTTAPEGDLETMRDAKGWLRRAMLSGYKETTDQAALTQLVDCQQIRARGIRSFRRLESAISELVAAIRENRPTSTPASPT